MFDLSLPGYKYLGPFNKLDKGRPTCYNDLVAYIHDLGYGRIIEKGGNPYFQWSETDARAYRRFSNGDYGGALGKAFFGLKQKLYEYNVISKFEGEVEDSDKEEQTFRDAQKDFENQEHPNRVRGIEDLIPEIEPVEPHAKRLRTGYPTATNIVALGNHHSARRVLFHNNTVDTKDSFVNFLPTRQVMSGNDQGLTETPVDKVDVYNIHRGPPKYTFASLPYVYDALEHVTKWSAGHYFRLTSPYNPQVARKPTNFNTSPGELHCDTLDTDSAAELARWYAFYADMYKYYHVISVRWHMTFENLTAAPLWVHKFNCNDNLPPQLATNQDMILWPDFESHYVGAAYGIASAGGGFLTNDYGDSGFPGRMDENDGAPLTGNYAAGDSVTRRGQSPILKLSGEYRPGDYDAEIRLDNKVENWTAVETNPALQELLGFRIRGENEGIRTNDTNKYDTIKKYRISVRLEYLTEFKELREGIRYPIQRQPIRSTVFASPTLGENEEKAT